MRDANSTYCTMWTSTEAGWCGLCDMDTEEGKCLEHEQVGCGGCKQGKGGGKQGCQRWESVN